MHFRKCFHTSIATTNYARWGPVYLAQMKQLPAEVQEEFDSGNWVVKGSSRRFNQLDPDQAQEWMNSVGKGTILNMIKWCIMHAPICKQCKEIVTKNLLSSQTDSWVPFLICCRILLTKTLQQWKRKESLLNACKVRRNWSPLWNRGSCNSRLVTSIKNSGILCH